MKNAKVIAIVLLIVGLGAGFFAGMKYQQSQSSSARFGNFQGTRNGSFGQRNQQGFRPVSGEIISTDDKSITVELADGSSRIVFLSDTTAISKSSHGAKSDLKTGEKVLVVGTDNSDGSITARNVQLNPQTGGFMR